MARCSVTSLTVYPVKGAQGCARDEIEIRRCGVVGDRELMLVKEDGGVIHQKEYPQLTQVEVEVLAGARRRFRHSKAGTLESEISSDGDVRSAKLQYNGIETCDQGDEVAAWFCDALQVAGVRLVSLRQAWDRWIPLPQFEGIDGKPQAQFYDVAPVLVGNQASLDDFNTRTHEPVPMDRFRVNVVVGGDLEPYGEDQLSSLTSDDIELRHVNVCERCILTTTDQTTGERPTKEPIKTLSTYRKIEDGKYASGVVFGLYMTPREDGVLRVGDTLEIAHFA